MAQQLEEVIIQTELPFKLDQITIGDGNCFPRAIVQQSQRNPVKDYLRSRQANFRTYMELKKGVCQFMLKESNVPMLQEFKVRFEARQVEARLRGESADTWNQYWMKMEKDGEWVDAVFVQATAWYLYSDIHLIHTATATKENPFFTINGNYTSETASCPGPAILLGYNSNLHYQSVLPIGEKQERVAVLDSETIDIVLGDVRRGEKSSHSGESITLLQTDRDKEVSKGKLTDITNLNASTILDLVFCVLYCFGRSIIIVFSGGKQQGEY